MYTYKTYEERAWEAEKAVDDIQVILSGIRGMLDAKLSDDTYKVKFTKEMLDKLIKQIDEWNDSGKEISFMEIFEVITNKHNPDVVIIEVPKLPPTP